MTRATEAAAAEAWTAGTERRAAVVDELGGEGGEVGQALVGLLLRDLAVGHRCVDPCCRLSDDSIDHVLCCLAVGDCQLGQRLAVLQRSDNLIAGDAERGRNHVESLSDRARAPPPKPR